MDQDELGHLESVIERGQQTFVEVGQAPREARENTDRPIASRLTMRRLVAMGQLLSSGYRAVLIDSRASVAPPAI